MYGVAGILNTGISAGNTQQASACSRRWLGLLTIVARLVSQATPFARKKKMRKGLVTVHTMFRSIPHL